MKERDAYPIVFVQGGNLLQIARSYDADSSGFIGLRNGRILARSSDAFSVARRLIAASPVRKA